MWPGGPDRDFYDNSQVKANRLRCIMQNKADRQSYFVVMSTAMAITCDIFATVLDPDPNDVRLDGIWGQHEFPQLQQYGNDGIVYNIEAMNSDATQVAKFWTRAILDQRDANGTVESNDWLAERGADDECGIVDDATAAAFDEGGEYPVDW